VGVVGAVIVAVLMLAGPLSDDPGPDAVERFVIFAYPICLLLGGVFAAIKVRIGLVYGGLAMLFAATYVVMALTADDSDWDGFAEAAVFTMLVVGPALILTSLCWSVMRESGEGF
jgi:hypothetical protein